VNCPFCAKEIDPKDFYCPECGKKVREKPIATTFWPVFLLFVLCVLLPPFNIGMTLKYIRSPDLKAKKIGWISLVVMAIMLIAVGVSTYYMTKYVSDQVNTQITQELKKYQNLGY
jgi:NADH:ubiquinone oxidoreductase subunit 3 (subunit A)